MASNPWLENATLNALLDQAGYLDEFGADVIRLEAPGVAGPFDAIDRGEADICMVSGYNQVLPRIARGAAVRIVGAGMRKAALAIFAYPQNAAELSDLAGKTVAVGPSSGLLHTLMVRLLKDAGLDPRKPRFVNFGSNEQCFRAVVEGRADACCASISHLGNSAGLSVVRGGEIWDALPGYTFQLAYASCAAIAENHEGLVAVMAAFGKLYDDLMSSEMRDAYFAARRSAMAGFDEVSARATWDFIRTHRPYSSDLALSGPEIDYLQEMLVDSGCMTRALPFSAVADMSAATEAARLLGRPEGG